MVRGPPVNAGEARDEGSIPGSRRSPGAGNSNPPQYSCLGNSMDRGAWRATVHWVTQSQTQLSDRAHTHQKDFPRAHFQDPWRLEGMSMVGGRVKKFINSERKTKKK